MAVDQVFNEYKGLLTTLGRAALHATFPNDFEYYAITLELTDSTDKLMNALTFPVMPTSISEFKQDISNQKKSSAGVVSLYDTTFVPFDISLSGTFGRKLRLLIDGGLFTAIANGIKSPSSLLGKGEEDPPTFNRAIKTGYGAIKLLEKIRKEAYGIDKEGAPVRLYLYNLALHSQYLVEFKSLRIMQDQANNMLWNYQANFKAIAPAYSIRNTKLGTLTTLGASTVSAGMNQLASNAF
jgi:hypothetical protein